MKNSSTCCRRTILFSFAFLFFLALQPFSAKASHLMGGEITVTHLTGTSYRITQKIYRDCAGIPLGTSTSVSIASAGLSTTNATLSRVSIVDRSILCPGQVSRCVSTSGVPGIEEHTYQGTVTLLNNRSYTISSSLNARNSVITTLVNPGSQNMYVATTFFTGDNGGNSSPQFLNVPVGNFCANQPASLSPNGFDADGDAMVFSLINARQTATNPVTYAAGFNGLNPLTSSTGVSINPNTGLISFTPTVINQVSVICVKVEEYRNGVKIGEIIRDLQVRMINCGGNNPPVIAPLAGVVVPVGTPYCVNISATDADNNNITLTAASGIIPPATFVITGSGAGFANATFCFTPTAADAGNNYSVSINAVDNACPSPGTSVRTFNITVPAACNVSISGSTTPAACGATDGSATASLSGGIAPYQYSWSGPNGYTSTNQSPTGLSAGQYCVTIVDGNNCVADACYTVAGGSSSVQLSATQTNNTCALSNGAINAVATGGNAPYSYSLNGATAQASGTFENLAAGTYTVAVADAGGCGTTSTFVLVEESDATPPTALCQNILVSLDAFGYVAISAADIDNGSNDNCGAVTLGVSPSSFDCSQLGANTVTLTVTDASGNTASCQALVMVRDTFGPDIECEHDIELILDGAGEATLAALDVLHHDHENCSILGFSLSQQNFTCANLGENHVTLTAVDQSGNASSCEAHVTVTDNINPVITCPAAIAVGTDAGQCGASVTYNVGYSDNCGATIVQTAGLASGSVFPVGTTTNTFVVTDAAGNSASCSFDVTVTDTELPTVQCPAAIAQSTDAGQCGASVTYNVGYSDNCGATIVQTAGLASGSVFPVGTTTNTFVVTDAAGNSASCSFDVTISDTEIPTVSCPADFTVSASYAGCSAIVNYSLSSSDNCGAVVTQTEGLASGSAFPLGTTVNSFSVTDAAGNSVSCGFTVTVTSNLSAHAGNDEAIYFGYAADQSVVRTATASGGAGGYSYQWTLNRALLCNQVVSSGDEVFSGGSCSGNVCPASGSLATAPSCSGSATLTTSLIQDGIACVRVTDAVGCVATDCFNIEAVDARCFAGNSTNVKVQVCHRTNSNTNPWVQICIAQAAVPTHLADNHLDYLGRCFTPGKTDEEDADASAESISESVNGFSMKVYPNPVNNALFVDYETPVSAEYQVQLFDNLGRVALSTSGTAFENGNRLTVPVQNLAPGVYYLMLSVGEEKSSVRVVVSH